MIRNEGIGTYHLIVGFLIHPLITPEQGNKSISRDLSKIVVSTSFAPQLVILDTSLSLHTLEDYRLVCRAGIILISGRVMNYKNQNP